MRRRDVWAQEFPPRLRPFSFADDRPLSCLVSPETVFATRLDRRCTLQLAVVRRCVAHTVGYCATFVFRDTRENNIPVVVKLAALLEDQLHPVSIEKIEKFRATSGSARESIATFNDDRRHGECGASFQQRLHDDQALGTPGKRFAHFRNNERTLKGMFCAHEFTTG